MGWKSNRHYHRKSVNGQGRIKVLAAFFVIVAAITIIKLFDLQILKGHFYTALASGQHELYQKLFPERGSIYVVENNGGQQTLFPLVTNKKMPMLYAVPSIIVSPEETAKVLFEILGLPEDIDIIKVEAELFVDISADLDPKMAEEIKQARRETWYEEQNKLEVERLTNILSKADDPYEPIRRRLIDQQVEQIEALNISGLAFKDEVWRFYPDKGMGGHVFGFWGYNYEDDTRSGKYGLEGYFDQLLAGEFGEIRSERDAWGNIIPVASHNFKEKEDGADLVLTIDRAIQYKACQSLYQAVDYFKAKGGAVVVMEPKTGAILAMCGAPDFDPDEYSKVENIDVYNNPVIFNAYEPGSIFKPITMAAALDVGKVDPNSTFTDTGSETIGEYTINNFDDKVYGVQTMTEVLEKSINTGVIYAMRQITPKVFADYIKDFDFGQPTGIQLNNESAGNISNLDQPGEIWAATASYGQGIQVTPLQMVKAMGAIANGGKMMKPYIVSQILYSKNEVENILPEEVRQVISAKAALMLSGMMVSVVENGHAKTAAVSGYRVAGKTGTAQVASTVGRGYTSDVITSFVGFAPFSDPKFVILVRLDKPQWAKTGVESAAPVFKDIAKFILQYYNVPYDGIKDQEEKVN